MAIIPELEAMRAGVDFLFPISCKKLRVNMRPLTITEISNITSEIVEEMSGLTKSGQTRIEENSSFTKKVLELASSPPDTFAPKLSQYILALMTPEELTFLFKQWVSGCDKCNPMLESLPADEVKALADKVKKSPSEAIDLSFLQLVNVCQFLISNG